MPGAERALTVQATRRLVALGMVCESAAGVAALPALARFGYGEPLIRGLDEAS